MKLKRLFLISISIVLLFSSCQTKSNDTLSYEEGYALRGREASAYYYTLLCSNENVELRYNYIYSLFENRDYYLVIDECEIAEELYPQYSRFLKIKANAYKELEDIESYSSTLSRILALEPYNEEIFNLYIDSLLLLGEKEKAITASYEALHLFTENKKIISVLSEENEFYKNLL